jgi:hypothetical protein
VTPYDAVLHAARDLPEAGTALEAELLGAALLGSVYAVAETERAKAVREFVGGFLGHTARRRTAAARAIRSVFAALVPDAAGSSRVRPGPNPPPWMAELGRVRLLGTWAYGDVFGDQTSYLASFAYQEPELGGPEHAVVALVDHNIGIVKDLFVQQPAGRLLQGVRRAAETDPLVWLSDIDPSRLRAHVSFYLGVTDGLSTLPDDGSLATDRALACSRLATLPPTTEPVVPGVPALDELLPSFLESPAGAALDPADPSTQYAIRLILEFAQDAPDSDPLRWSPAVVGLFLLDWVHRRAVLDEQDVTVLPRVLRAWAGWASTRRGLPGVAVAAIDDAIDTMTPEFVRRYGTGPGRSIPHPR